MVLKQDQERIKTLLKDTITLLCKNGLTFQNEFSLEALIGITLDKDDVFLVSINEIVQTEIKTTETSSVESDGSATSTGRRQRKRHRSKITRRPSNHSCDGEMSDSPPPERKKIKNEDDLVFVKQETTDWSQNPPIDEEEEDEFGNSLDLASLEPVPPAHLGDNLMGQHHRGNSVQRRTATVTASNQLPPPPPLSTQPQQMGYPSPASLLPSAPTTSVLKMEEEESLPLSLTSKADTALNLTCSAVTTVANHTPAMIPQPALPPNFVVLSPAMMGSVLGHPLMSPPPALGLPAAGLVSPLAKALTGANILASVAQYNLPRPANLSVANLTVTSPSIRGPRLANDLPLSSPLSLKTTAYKPSAARMRRASACSSTGSMEPPAMANKPRTRPTQRRSSVDVVVSKLNAAQETEIITFVNNMSKLGFKVTVREVCSMAHEMIFPKKQYKKVDLTNVKVFGPDWWKEFLNRHPEVEEREGQVLPCSAPRSV